jgi:hypothetical protein
MSLTVEVIDQFADKNWRLTNLYYIIDDSGQEVHFQPNPMQLVFLAELWYLNDILKGRQHGFTTLIDLWILDECVFYPNLTGGIIAHTLDDVKKIFRRKIKGPWERLPDGIKLSNPATNDTANELIFANRSEISVDTSMRSGTMNMLHVSEFGKISSVYPEKAVEIKTGSFNTVHPGNFIFVESTGHGRGGEFYALTKAARDYALLGRPLSKLDFKYHFYPWWMNPKYQLDDEDTANTPFNRQHIEYFARVEKKINTLISKFGATQPWLVYWRDTLGGRISLNQRAWYVKKFQINGPDMLREYPSHDEEPFEAIIVGAIFGEDMVKVRQEGRITKVRYEPALAVNTWWDIGRRDKTAIWFYQQAGNEMRFIWYHEDSFKGLPHYTKLLTDLRIEQKWNTYGTHLGPHDMSVTEYGSDKTRFEMARNLGYHFFVSKQFDQIDQINAGRALLPMCMFDEENCSAGVACLENARREWNDHLQSYANEMLHNEFSHGASSFMNGAMNMNLLSSAGRARALPVAEVKFPT